MTKAIGEDRDNQPPHDKNVNSVSGVYYVPASSEANNDYGTEFAPTTQKIKQDT